MDNIKLNNTVTETKNSKNEYNKILDRWMSDKNRVKKIRIQTKGRKCYKMIYITW